MPYLGEPIDLNLDHVANRGRYLSMRVLMALDAMDDAQRAKAMGYSMSPEQQAQFRRDRELFLGSLNSVALGTSKMMGAIKSVATSSIPSIATQGLGTIRSGIIMDSARGIEGELYLQPPRVSPELLETRKHTELLENMPAAIADAILRHENYPRDRSSHVVTYIRETIVLDGTILIGKTHYGRENDLVFSFLYKNPNKKFTHKQVEKGIGNGYKLEKSLPRIVDGLGFRYDARKMFFEVSETHICFRNPVNFEERKAMGIDFIRFSNS